MDSPSDEELIAAHLEGDGRAFPALLERHLQEIYSFAVRLGGAEDADDIAQETFVKVWKSLPKYRARHAQFRTWLYSIARNTTIDFLRKKKQLPFSAYDDFEGGNALTETLADEMPLPDETFAKAENKALLEAALLELPLRAREVLLLRYRQDLTFEEIGKALGEPLNTVKSRHRRALGELRSILERSTKR